MYFGTIQDEVVEKYIVPDSVQKQQFAEKIEKIANLDLHDLFSQLAQEAVWIALKLIGIFVIYFVGRWFIHWLVRRMEVMFERRQVEVSLRSFFKNLVKAVLYIVLVLMIIQILGVNTSSIVALLASAGLAIGMALGGTLQNFAGGVMILILRPYRVGDYIMAQNQSGTVKEIRLFTTTIETVDRQVIYIPNSTISTSIINNYSEAKNRRVDWTIGISYGDDVEVARKAIEELLAADSRVLNEPKVAVYVSALADSAVTISVRAWVRNKDYWDLFFKMNEEFYKTLPERGIHFPFPQVDVHLKKE